MALFDYAPDAKRVEQGFDFIQKLWSDTHGQSLRDELFKEQNLVDVQRVLAPLGFELPVDVQVVLVDVEGGRTKTYPDPIDKQGRWYVLVLPPRPTRSKDSQYQDQIAWLEATFHASNDGYGM